MAFNVGNVRAYDVKAQISLAAFVLSPQVGLGRLAVKLLIAAAHSVANGT